MGFNSKAYLAHEEAQLIDPPVTGGHRERRTGLSDLWASAEIVRDIEQQQRQWEEERNKLKNQ